MQRFILNTEDPAARIPKLHTTAKSTLPALLIQVRIEDVGGNELRPQETSEFRE